MPSEFGWILSLEDRGVFWLPGASELYYSASRYTEKLFFVALESATSCAFREHTASGRQPAR